MSGFHRGAIIADRYRFDRPLNGGGIGVIWQGTDLQRSEPIALKVTGMPSTR